MKKSKAKTEMKMKLCTVCEKEVDENQIIRVKIYGNSSYGTVYDVCKECAEKNGYEEYDGSDFMSDWN